MVSFFIQNLTADRAKGNLPIKPWRKTALDMGSNQKYATDTQGNFINTSIYSYILREI